jgi:hypothetical protein
MKSPTEKQFFKLVGDVWWLEEMATRFRRSPVSVKKIREDYYLEVENSQPVRSDEEYWALGNTELARLTGIALIFEPHFETPKIDGFTEQDPGTGELRTAVRLGGRVEIKGRVRVHLMVGGQTMLEKDSREEFVLALTRTNEYLERALYIYGALPHTWRNLSMVMDAIEEGNKGVKGIEKRLSILAGKVLSFRTTANTFEVTRLESRHAFIKSRSKQGKKVPYMTLPDAQVLIRDLLHKWTELLSTDTSGSDVSNAPE